MKIAIVGAGAVGGYYGAMLSKAGFSVTFIARGRHLEAMKKNGLQIHSPDGHSFIADGLFTDDFQAVEEADLVFITVKSTETRETAEKLVPFLKTTSTVLTLQNGVDNEEILAEVLGAERVLAGVTYISAKVDEPGAIRRFHPVQTIVFGALKESEKHRADSLAAVLERAGIDYKMTDDVLSKKWQKFIWNATFNPLSAASLATVGDILDKEPLRQTAEAVLGEVVAVGQELGIRINHKWVEQLFSSSETARFHKTSMLQDREGGKPMEIESLCGYVVRQGRKVDVPTPTLNALYAILTSVEAKAQNRQ